MPEVESQTALSINPVALLLLHIIYTLWHRFVRFMGITCLESFTASSMGLAVGSIAPTGNLYLLLHVCMPMLKIVL